MLHWLGWLVKHVVLFNVLLVAVAGAGAAWIHWLIPKLDARRARRRAIQELIATSSVDSEPTHGVGGAIAPQRRRSNRSA